MTTPFTKLIEETEKEKKRLEGNVFDEYDDDIEKWDKDMIKINTKLETLKQAEKIFNEEIERWKSKYYTAQKAFCEHNDRVKKEFSGTLEKIKERLNNTLNKWEYCDNCGNQLSCGCEEADNYNLMRKEINSVISEFQSPLSNREKRSLPKGHNTSPADTLNSMEKK